MKSRVFKISLLIGLALSLLISGCSLNKDKVSTDDNKPIPVVVKNVELKTTEKEDRYIGSVAASKDIMVLPKLNGKVQQIYVSQGDYVKKGQLLVKIDDSDYKQSLRQAELSYDAAVSNLNQTKEGKSSNILNAESQLEQAQDSFNRAKENLDKTKALYEAGAVAKNQLEQAQTGFLQAENGLKLAKDAVEKSKSETSIKALESQVDQAKIGVEKARSAISDTNITSPISGVVAALNVEEGEFAGPQNPVAQIVNQNRMIAKLNISELSLQDFKEGDTVTVKIPSINEKLEGTVTFIAPAANSQTLTFPIEIDVNNKDNRLKSGMLVEVVQKKSSNEKQIIVPTQAIIGTGKDSYVFVIKDNKAEKRQVKIAEMSSAETVIEEGVSENEPVVIKGQYELTNGTEVEVIKEEGTTNEAS